MTNATLICGNLEPTRTRWKNGQVHSTTLRQGKQMCKSVTVSSLCAFQQGERDRNKEREIKGRERNGVRRWGGMGTTYHKPEPCVVVLASLLEPCGASLETNGATRETCNISSNTLVVNTNHHHHHHHQKHQLIGSSHGRWLRQRDGHIPTSAHGSLVSRASLFFFENSRPIFKVICNWSTWPFWLKAQASISCNVITWKTLPRTWLHRAVTHNFQVEVPDVIYVGTLHQDKDRLASRKSRPQR